MSRWRDAIVCLFITLAGLCPPSPSHAEQAFQRFLPFFIDLEGWEGKQPDGLALQMPDSSMTTATRDYVRGPAQAQAAVMMGAAASGALAPIEAGTKLETGEGHMVTSTMHDMKVMKTYNIPHKSGALMVALGKDAVFSFSYRGIGEDEATTLAEKFDWKAMQAAAEKK